MRGCTEREGTLLATNRPPLAASAGAASKSMRPTTAATAADTTIVVLILAAPSLRLRLFSARKGVLYRRSRTHEPAPSAAPGNELGRGLCPRRRPPSLPPSPTQDPSASVPAELGAVTRGPLMARPRAGVQGAGHEMCHQS